MTTGNASRFSLYAGLALATVLFGARAEYAAGLRIAIAVALPAAIALAAWKTGARALKSADADQQRLATAGCLLILPFAAFALLAGYGRPDQATHAQNQSRYVALLINAIAVGGGLALLAAALRDAQERFLSTLGLAAILFATPVYLVWAALCFEIHRVLAAVGPGGAVPAWLNALNDLSDVLLFFGGALTYAATAALAAAAGRAKWLGRRTARAYVIAGAVALLCLALRGLRFPDPAEVFKHAYAIPGFVAGIPAVPWIMPCLIGVSLLRRAGEGRQK